MEWQQFHRHQPSTHVNRPHKHASKREVAAARHKASGRCGWQQRLGNTETAQGTSPQQQRQHAHMHKHKPTHTHPHAPTRTESKTNKKLLLCADMHAAKQQSKEALGAVVSSTTTQTHNAQTHRPTQSSKHGVAVLVIVIVITASISTVHIEVQSDHRIPPAAVARAIRWRLIPSPPAPHHTPRLRRLHSTR